jgi:starch-binding outer membrane protein, SusD/RagB family
MKKYILKSSLIAACMMTSFACTDLEEKTFSEATGDKFYVNTKSFESALVPAYASLRGYIWNYWNLSEHTSDELQGPTRGGDWGDGGQWVRLNSHELLPGEGLINDLYSDLFTGVSRSNIAIETFKGAPDSVKEKALFVAEARGLRAFYYYLLCDTFGNVPIVTAAKSDPANPPAQAKRAEVFAFVEKELKEVLPLLLDKDKAPNGRFDKGAANAVLAKLFLNAKIWTGTDRSADAISAADAIISTGKYSLNSLYFDNFKTTNEGSPETILSAGFSSKVDLGFPNMNFYMRSLHYNQISASPWNGFSTTADIYDGFDKDDVRKSVFWEGQQYSGFSWPAKGTSGTPLNDRPGKPLVFTKECPIVNATEGNGVRVIKYQPDVAAPGGQGENDFIIFRLADIMLVKAEALVRTGKAADALPLVNKLRARAGLKDLTSIDIDGIYAERTNEMFWEGVRRQDQIRFGKFLDAYSNKPKSDPRVLLFPIPTNQLANNPKLVQNDGYLK